ncbi:hypothetical protein B0H11DRAFT_1200015 [Mycena galericulata]|nr:hypothetical protein B0H11DRAFT_1200015 [Mycena galericulata]
MFFDLLFILPALFFSVPWSIAAMPFCGADTSSTAAVSFCARTVTSSTHPGGGDHQTHPSMESAIVATIILSCCTEPLRERETTLDSQRVQREIMSSEHDLALGCDGLSFPPPPPYMPRPPLDLQSEMRDGYAAWGAPRSLAV